MLPNNNYMIRITKRCDKQHWYSTRIDLLLSIASQLVKNG